MPRLARTAFGALADLLFPPACPVCRELLDDPGLVLCPICRGCLEPVTEPICPRCGLPIARPGRLACPSCRSAPPLRIRSAFLYGGPLADAIVLLKHGRRELARPLAALWLNAPLPGFDWVHDLLVPIALHCRRLHRRGYNQADLLARELGRARGLPVASESLLRVRDTPSQAEMPGRAARVANVQGAFTATRRVSGLRVCLVDDVATTGATLRAAAQALCQAGAREVAAVTLARAV